MQNVHVMRPEVRAEYERLAGDARRAMPRSTIGLARFFTELRDPLEAVYGDDPRLEGELAGLLDSIARAAAARGPGAASARP